MGRDSRFGTSPPQTPSRHSGLFLFNHDQRTNTHGYHIHGFNFFLPQHRVYFFLTKKDWVLSRYTTRKRALKSHRLSETPIVWRNTSDTFTPRGLGYNSASCELVKCFELTESDGKLRRSCLRRQPAWLQPCARLITLSSEEDLRGNTAKLVE